jgi:hypothetical protein
MVVVDKTLYYAGSEPGGMAAGVDEGQHKDPRAALIWD